MIPSWEQWQGPLAEALLHFLWQGMLIAFPVGGLFHLLAARSPELRYGIGLLGLFTMAACPIATFYSLMPSPPGGAASLEAGIVFTQTSENTALAPRAFRAPAPRPVGVPVKPAESGSYDAWIVGGWSVGVLAFGARLLCGFIGLYRWSWPRAPIPMEIREMVQRLTVALGMRVPRVFLSRRVYEALALGIVRPLILIPAAWLTELSPPMLEAVLAHQLAHIRRHDLWFNFLQRLVETLLFYHPAVWWLSARLRQERELCCDGLAVSVTGDRLTYARTLEQVARLAVSRTHSGWALTIGGKRMNLLNRVHKVLGMAPAPRAHRPWLAGLLALIVPAALWLAMSTVEPAAMLAGEQADQATGTVVDDQGKPVAGVKIQVLQEGDLIRELRADAQGQFKVPLAWRSNTIDDRTLVVRDRDRLGWFALSQQRTDAAKKPDFRMVLVPLARQIQGELVDEKGNPLVDFPVGVETMSQETNGFLYVHGGYEPFLPKAKTDAAGRFQMTVPAANHTGLRLLHPDRLAMRLTVPKGKVDLGTIVVGPAGRIEGRVTDAKTGRPLATARVGAQYVGREGMYLTGGGGDGRSDKDGRFIIGGLLPGQYNALFWGINSNPKLVASGKEGIVVKAGKTMTVDFQVSEGRRLAGKVIDVASGKPVPNFHVGYYGADRPRSGAACRMVLTDEQGSFEFYVSPGPSYVYVAQGPQMGISDHARTVELTAERDVANLILQATTKTEADFGIYGKVIAKSQEQTQKREQNQDWRLRIRLRTPVGLQVNGVTYYIIRGNSRHYYGSGTFAGNRYDGDAWGKGLKGIISLFLDADGFTPVRTKEFEFSKRMEPLIVDLQPAAQVPVRGRVVDADDKPVPVARVRAGRFIVSENLEFPWGVETTTDAEGKFEFKRLHAGERLFVYADKPGVGGVKSARFLLEKEEPFQVPELKIPRGNLSLEGVVTDYKDEVVAGALVQAFDGFPQAQGQSVKNTANTDAKGRFHLKGLLPGKVWLQVEASGFRMRNAHAASAGAKDVHVYAERIPDPKEKLSTLKVELRPRDGGKVADSEYWWIEVGKGVVFSSSRQGNENAFTVDYRSRLNLASTYALAIAPKGFAWPKPIVVKGEKIGETVVAELDRAAPVALRGRVVDDQGQPVAGVKVALSRTLFDKIADEPWRYEADMEFPVTDIQGHFGIPDLQPGCEVAVYVNKGGYTGTLSAKTTLPRGQDTMLPDIRLLPSQRTITGSVVDAQGNPVAGAKVAVNIFVNIKATTGADGKFQLTHVPHGDLYLTVDAEDYPVADAIVKADENQVRVTVGQE